MRGVLMLTAKNCREFLEDLASAAPTPGGGGASALVGAIGMALGSMVGNLTFGKKKYLDVQEDIARILDQAAQIRQELAELVERDAEVFEPLAQAYRLPKSTAAEQAIRAETLEKALKLACSVPLEIMYQAQQAIDLHAELVVKGSRIAISDVGVGVLFCKSALQGAALNVLINTKLMQDRVYAAALNTKTEAMLAEGAEKADRTYQEVEAALK
jgi:formiminotetrahydrofolate cyclodeaminase